MKAKVGFCEIVVIIDFAPNKTFLAKLILYRSKSGIKKI
jgi:hypothetical protein